MGFKCGIVGLPNVGKSTLFNALTASKNAEAANFPFCTIDPNIGIVDVIDERLDKLTLLPLSFIFIIEYTSKLQRSNIQQIQHADVGKWDYSRRTFNAITLHFSCEHLEFRSIF